MRKSNPLRNAVSLAALSMLLLTAGMCGPAGEGPEPGTAEMESSEKQARREAEAARVALEQEAAAAERAAAEQQRRLEERERQLREEQAQLAAERERQLEAERRRLAAEKAAAEERARQLAERERQLREQQAELERREQELTEQETIVVEANEPEPLPEPTGSYEGNFDEPWRESREPAVADGEAGGQQLPAKPATTTASVRAGERLEVQLVDTLTSETARVGDRFSTRLVEDLRDASGRVVVPAGAEVVGRVSEVSPYRRGGGPATLAVEFTEIAISPEQRVGIRASFVELGADRRKNRKKVVAGAVVGAILGHILGGDGSKNVIVGAAAGAAASGAMVASARDRDAEIPAGEILTLQLEEVVTVEVKYGPPAGARR